MKILVAYYSKFGNGQAIAEAIGRGFTEAGHEVTLTSVESGPVDGDYDLVVLGSPTRAGRMMGPAKGFIKRELKKDAWEGKRFIAVGTGFRPKGDGKKRDQYGARSAEKVYEALEIAGLEPLMEPQKFFVADMKGPLEDGELERAAELGRSAGRSLGTS